MYEETQAAFRRSDHPVRGIDLVFNGPGSLRADTAKAEAANDVVVCTPGRGRLTSRARRVRVGDDLTIREASAKHRAYLVGVRLLDGELVPDMESVADSAAENASHDADVEVGAPVDRPAGVLDVFANVLVGEAWIDPTRERLKAR